MKSGGPLRTYDGNIITRAQKKEEEEEEVVAWGDEFRLMMDSIDQLMMTSASSLSSATAHPNRLGSMGEAGMVGMRRSVSRSLPGNDISDW